MKVTVNSSHPCSSTHNQSLALLSTDCFLECTHFNIGVVFVRQSKSRHEPSAVLFGFQENSPLLSIKLHSTYETSSGAIHLTP
jgi:hypothetical protein